MFVPHVSLKNLQHCILFHFLAFLRLSSVADYMVYLSDTNTSHKFLVLNQIKLRSSVASNCRVIRHLCNDL